MVFLLLAVTQPGFAAERVSAADTEIATLANKIEAVTMAANKWPRMHSLLVSQGGKVIFEQYYNGRSPDQLANVKSVSKSVLSALVGIAIARGEISGVDATLKQYIPDEVDRASSPLVGNITVENLLTMQAGLRPTSSTNYGAWVASRNWIASALAAPFEAEPGEEMLYSTANTHLLSAVLTRATGRSTLQYARERLSEPLGFSLAPWPRDPQGVYFGGNDMEFTPWQLLSLGELYLNHGRSGALQVIPPDWISDSFQPHAKSPHGDARYYGYGWWLAELSGYVVPHAWGHGGQFIMLVPELDLVLVSTSSPGPGPAAQVHANNVFGLLQRVIRVVGTNQKPRFYIADNQRPTTRYQWQLSALF